MCTEMRAPPYLMRAMIISLPRRPVSTDRSIAGDIVQHAIVESDAAGLRFVQDTGLLCFVLGEGVECQGAVCSACEGYCCVQVCVDDGEDGAEEFFGEERVSWFYVCDDCWGEEAG